MGIIDRYLLRQFLQTLVICYLSLTGLYVVFDLFTNLEEFLQAAEKGGGLWKLMLTYYSHRAIYFFDRTSGLLTLVAAMFTLTWLQRHNELTALMAAGVSKLRAAAPVLGAAAVIAVLAAANRELVIPRFQEELSRKTTDLLGDRGQAMAPRYDHDTGVRMWGESTYSDRKRISKPDFLLPSSLARYGEQLAAKEAFYEEADGPRPAGYRLKGVTSPAGLDAQPSLPAEGDPVLITPRDAPDWLAPGECFVVSGVTFDHLTGGQAWRQYASTPALVRGIRNSALDFGADVRVTIHSRIVQPALDLTLLLLGVPLVLTRENRNVFVAIGACIAMVTLFTLVVLGFQYMGNEYLIAPSLAAWGPLMVFVPVAAGLSEPLWERSHRKTLRASAQCGA